MTDAASRSGRLPTPRWRDARLLLGVVMVLFAVVAGARVFASADRYSAVYVARGPLVPGEHLTAADLAVARVRFANRSATYVGAGAAPVGYVVTRYVAAGELLPATAVSSSASVVSSSRFVTVAVQAGHAPSDLGRGDLVDVYVTAKSGSAPSSPALVAGGLSVAAYDDGSGALSGAATAAVVLDVPGPKVAAVVAAAEAGAIDLVRVPVATVAGQR